MPLQTSLKDFKLLQIFGLFVHTWTMLKASNLTYLCAPNTLHTYVCVCVCDRQDCSCAENAVCADISVLRTEAARNIMKWKTLERTFQEDRLCLSDWLTAQSVNLHHCLTPSPCNRQLAFRLLACDIQQKSFSETI